jgi:peroxiredoxin
MKQLFLILLFSLTIVTFACSSGDDKKSEKKSADHSILESVPSDIKVGINIGEKAPDIDYPSPSGENIALSSLRGKLVLIDFWAAWCPPCRAENPNIVRTYNEYKDKEFINGTGFTVYGVSLDQEKSKWVQAIEQDNLSWPNHVSDLKFWSSVPAAMYQVRGIPANFLIDGKGIIIAKNLRGEALGAKLAELQK